METKQSIDHLMKEIVNHIEEKQGDETVVLNLQDISSMCDYFIISSASSERQLKSIADEIRDGLEEKNIFPNHVEGMREARWILLDYGDIVIHLFLKEDREYYGLETIWKDAPVVNIDTL
ncbi:ribosome-associated protein [Tindallia magadiensis]|uniref:Ribosomal silencing factor RsfS n=1 Tax=Tindallia magadiensis TaxID=69895 RepID=A0A1I3A8Z1_9FIRM|nr:ribosome silencing factor [Tindallia magadiensis]SFH46370.1 ribosome-associated protein [Tindallia magadiensis]